MTIISSRVGSVHQFHVEIRHKRLGSGRVDEQPLQKFVIVTEDRQFFGDSFSQLFATHLKASVTLSTEPLSLAIKAGQGLNLNLKSLQTPTDHGFKSFPPALLGALSVRQIVFDFQKPGCSGLGSVLDADL